MKIKVTPLVLTAAMSFFATWSTTASASAPFRNSDNLIVPGKRIGPIELGMSDQALFKLGVPDETRPGGSLVWYFYRKLKVIVDQNTHKVVFVQVYSDSSYHLSNGLHIGATLSDVERTMGPADSFQTNQFFAGAIIAAKYDGGNLSFSFTPDGSSMAVRPGDRVQRIMIQLPGAQMF